MKEIDICKGCGYKRIIVNKKYYLCQECNRKRLHPEKPIKKIRKVSARKKVEHENLKQVYAEIEGNCFFCGSPNNLTNAHIIRRSYSERLITDNRNIVHACMRCHNTFDNGTVEEIRQLPNLNKILKKMEQLDRFYYERFKLRLGIDIS